jgi:hypothetical protein
MNRPPEKFVLSHKTLPEGLFFCLAAPFLNFGVNYGY